MSPQYEAAEFARKHGITEDQARAILAHSGASRDRADEAARFWKRR